MNTEAFDTYTLSANHTADTMPSGLTLYTENMPHAQVAYILTLADGQGLAWSRDLTMEWTWTDRIIYNAVRNETDLTRLGRLLGMYGIETQRCNHVTTQTTVKETTIAVVRPVPQDGDDDKLPARYHIIRESPLGAAWVDTYTWTDHMRATDRDAAMRLIEDMERQK